MIKTRFAPSPTGVLHIGGARTALFCWAYARRYQGHFLLRVEDTDNVRSTETAVETIINGMQWLGLDFDEGPYFQSSHYKRYKQAINELLEKGYAYRCFCSKARLDQLRQNQLANNETPRYDGACRYLNDSQSDKPYVVRFKTPVKGMIHWNDAVKGNIAFDQYELDDFIIARNDGSPTYNFCVVIDDIDMSITHVIRGEDHINNTPRQINLYQALGYHLPTFAHVPMILDENGQKLSKRHHSTSVMDYQKQGYLPHALLNYLVRLGWSYGDKEILTKSDIVRYFELNMINSSPSQLNFEKLNWLNQYYLRNLSVAELKPYLKPFFKDQGLNIEDGPSYEALLPVMVKKVSNLKQLVEHARFFYEPIRYYDPKARKKHLRPVAIRPLNIVYNRLKHLDDQAWQDETLLHQTLENIAIELGVNMAKVGMPVRVSITGQAFSPEIGTTLKLLGPFKTLSRIEAAIAYLNNR